MSRPGSLTEGSIGRGLLVFALPILGANVLQTLNGSINSIWVGRFLGEAALTATSNANTVMFLLIGAAFGVAMAASILVGQAIGAQDLREARRVVGTSASFFALISLGMAVLGLVFSRPLLASMGTPPDSLDLAVAYMRVIFLALPCLYMYAFAMAVLRGAGDSRTPFWFMLLSVVLDIALNPPLIFGAGPVPRIGIAGSALAAFLAQAVSLTAMVYNLYRQGHVLCLRGPELRYLRIDWRIAGVLVKKGVPMSAQMLVLSLAGVLMISLVNRHGVDTAAAYGATLQIWNYIQMPAFAVGMAVSSMAAQNVGAGKWDRVARIARVGVLYGVTITGGGVLLSELLDTQVFQLFLPAGSAALGIASHINRLATPSFVFFGVTLVLLGVVRASGAVLVPLVVVSIALLGVRFPFATLLAPRLGADSIWWSFPASSAVSALITVLYYRAGLWNRGRALLADAFPAAQSNEPVQPASPAAAPPGG